MVQPLVKSIEPPDNARFYELQDLMFAPKARQCSKDEYWEKVESTVRSLKEYCLKFLNYRPKGSASTRSSRIPPWVYRANNEYVIANLNPLLSRAIFTLKNCEAGDVEIRSATVDYYSRIAKIVTPRTMHKLDNEMSGNSSKMAHDYNDEIFFFSKPRGIICPSKDELDESFLVALNKRRGVDIDYDGEDSSIYIRTGFYATKEDLLWFIEKYWDEMAEQMDFSGRNNWSILEDIEEDLQYRMTKCLITCDVYSPKDMKLGPTKIAELIDRVFANKKSVTPKSLDTQRNKLEKDLANDPFNEAYEQLTKLSDCLALTADSTKARNRDNRYYIVIKNRAPLKFTLSKEMPDEFRELLSLAKNL